MKLCKRSFVVFLSFLLICLAPLGGIRADAKGTQAISIYLNGSKLITDAPPYIVPKKNITMVPLRVIGENLGAKVGWTQKTKTATIQKGNLALSMTVGQKYALVNGEQVPLDESVQVLNSRVIVPLRFVSVQLGLNVTWYQSAATIKLESKDGASSLRGAWISTVYNLTWPSKGSYGNAALQQQEYVQMLDELQDMGMNAVFVQVRPAADALYPSNLVPWSKVLNGQQGLAPTYDPLAFMIEETHRRGMAFHAWFNPFRAITDETTDKLAANHVVKTYPDWIVKSGQLLYINPGIPEARQHIIDTIMEVVNGYDIDGVHLDDYFYPSNGDFADDAAFAAFNAKQIVDKGDWRRDNINEFVRNLGQSIHAVKPKVSYGISPFGVWRNKAVDPTGSDTKAGVTTYDNMYADVRTWIRQNWVDYVMPQIYWSLSFSAARYDILVDWWTNEVRGTNVSLYIGHAAYKLSADSKEAGWNNGQEIVNQLAYNKQYPEIGGDVFFSAKELRANPLGLVQALKKYWQIK